jgi:hypothetical protein
MDIRISPLLVFLYFIDLNGFEVEHRPSRPSAPPILIPKGKYNQYIFSKFDGNNAFISHRVFLVLHYSGTRIF